MVKDYSCLKHNPTQNALCYCWQIKEQVKSVLSYGGVAWDSGGNTIFPIILRLRFGLAPIRSSLRRQKKNEYIQTLRVHRQTRLVDSNTCTRNRIIMRVAELRLGASTRVPWYRYVTDSIFGYRHGIWRASKPRQVRYYYCRRPDKSYVHFRLLHARKPFRRTDNNNNNHSNSSNVYPVVEFPGLELSGMREKTKGKKIKQ